MLSFKNSLKLAVLLALIGFSTRVWALQSDPSSPIAGAISQANAAVEAIIAIPDNQRSFDNTLGALDDLLARFETDTSMTMFMAYVSTDKAERDRGTLAEEHYNNWMIDLFKNEALFKAVNAVAAQSAKLEGEAKRLLDHTMRDFRRAGTSLSSEKRDEVKRIQKEISRLAIEFDKNIREDETVVMLHTNELAGLSEDFIARLKRSGDVVFVGMDYPTFTGIMDNCSNETTRKKVWLAYKRRGGLKNVAVLEDIYKLRAQAAELLGYKHSADYEIEIRMAKNARAVAEFYEKLRALVREKAKLDFEEYTQAKREHTGDPDAKLWPWDQNFYEKRLQRTKYAVDSRKVQEYFPMDRVIDGLFSITQSLYGLEYKEITDKARSAGRPVWHEDVRLFEVWDKARNEMLGEFYIDLHPRENKYTHAAQWGLVPRKVWQDGSVQKPLAALVCNFTKPTPEKPSLLTHDEVETFFHEFGHCLHSILTEAKFARFAGTAVERDFVEAPSQMFENWVWNADVLNTFAGHYQTGEKFPKELLEGMIRAKNLGSGLLAEHQFYYGLVDQAFNTAPKGEVNTTEVAFKLFEEVELYDAPPGTYYHASFGHLTNYVAGYYGYQWSLVYGQDMFQRFKELGMLSPSAGAYYRQKILARGGTVDAIDMVKEYLGREPSMDAYLEHLGLKRSETTGATPRN